MITKEQILEKIRINEPNYKKFGITSVGLFGSYLRGEQQPGSDIDLLVDFNPLDETFDNYMAAYDLFEKIFEDQKVEIITKNGLSPYIGPHILQNVLYV